MEYKNMSWQEQLRNGVKTVEDLDSYAKLNAEEKLRLSKVIDA